MPKTKRMKAAEIQAPQTREEAEALLGRIGRRQREVNDLENAMNEELAEIKERYESAAAPLIEQIEAEFVAVQAWAETNRTGLLDGRRKSARLATGEIGWRTSPPAVSLSRVKDVLRALHELGLGRFIRTKEEVDKEAILKEPEAVQHVKGISISQKEEFWIKPFESEIERSRARKVG